MANTPTQWLLDFFFRRLTTRMVLSARSRRVAATADMGTKITFIENLNVSSHILPSEI